MRSEWLSILTAVYLLFFMNGTFWDKSSVFLKGDALALLALGIGLLAGFIALIVTFSAKYVIKPVLIVIILAAVSGAWFMDRFGVIIDGEMIRNAMETNQAEAGHLITPAFILHMLLFGVLPALFIAVVDIVHRPILKKVAVNLMIILPCLVVFALAGLSNSGTFIFNIRQHRDWFRSLNPVFPMASAAGFLIGESKEQNIVVQPLGTDAKVADDLTSGQRKPRVRDRGTRSRPVGPHARCRSLRLRDRLQQPPGKRRPLRDGGATDHGRRDSRWPHHRYQRRLGPARSRCECLPDPLQTRPDQQTGIRPRPCHRRQAHGADERRDDFTERHT
jgi:hypothetical protein